MQRVLQSCVAIWIAVAACPVHAQAAAEPASDAKRVAALEAKAKAGNAEAQYELGQRYASGNGVPMDRERAFKLYSDAAAKGYAKAEYELARRHGGQTGSKIDLEQAFVYLQKAAEHGHGPAQVDLGFLYFNGNARVPKDHAQSFRWFRKAADGGAIRAQCMLGEFYKGGLGGVKQDHAEAFKWFRQTAVAKDPCARKSQYELYVSYESGNGVEKNLAAATGWLMRSAEGGNPRAQATLGRNYQKGYGVPQDAELGRAWLLKSREGVSHHEDHASGAYRDPTNRMDILVPPR
jgi:TPR repeat protein